MIRDVTGEVAVATRSARGIGPAMGAQIVESGAQGKMWEHDMNEWRWSFDVDVFGVAHGINAFVPFMLEQGTEADLAHTSSGNGGLVLLPSGVIHPTTKAAVVTITECLWAQPKEIGAPLIEGVQADKFSISATDGQGRSEKLNQRLASQINGSAPDSLPGPNIANQATSATKGWLSVIGQEEAVP